MGDGKTCDCVGCVVEIGVFWWFVGNSTVFDVLTAGDDVTLDLVMVEEVEIVVCAGVGGGKAEMFVENFEGGALPESVASIDNFVSSTYKTSFCW